MNKIWIFARKTVASQPTIQFIDLKRSTARCGRIWTHASSACLTTANIFWDPRSRARRCV